jgi:hypothetical protein
MKIYRYYFINNGGHIVIKLRLITILTLSEEILLNIDAKGGDFIFMEEIL